MMGHSHVVSGVAAGMALFGTAALSIPPPSRWAPGSGTCP